MMKAHLMFAATSALLMVLPTAAWAEPTLKSEVTVTGAIVTVGDMFADAGDLASTPLFRSPAPGTTGLVDLDAVRQAATRAGLTDYEAGGVLRVRVARSATVVDATLLDGLIDADLQRQGLLAPGIEADIRFDQPEIAINAEAVGQPAQLVRLSYTPGSGSFAARFQVAGIDLPVDVTGGIEMMTEVPQLSRSLPAGAVLSSGDVEMERVPAKFISASGIDSLDDVVGKALVRNSRAGMMLKASDVSEPLVVTRNAAVTVYYRIGPMTLTVKGQSLSDASAGEPADVMNTITHKILHGTATASGAVEIDSGNLTVAGL